jgi:predicted helicase
MHTFDDIYVLDLHGNAKKKETAPDGSEDENVFDIMQGVAVCIMVRKPRDRARSQK